MARVITLGKEGLLADNDLKIDYLMSSYFFSKYSQTSLYRGSIKSLTKIIQQHGNDPLAMKSALEDSLTTYLNNFFQSVSISVTVEDPDAAGTILLLNGIVSSAESIQVNPVSLGYSLLTRDSTVKKIINITNGTDLLTS